MLNTFNNLPGIFVAKGDGNVQILESVPGNVVLVAGTSPAGPAGQIYLGQDTSASGLIFDPLSTKNGTLLRTQYEVLSQGSQYTALYRIGAKVAGLDFVNGKKILTKESESTTGTKYRLLYSFDAASQTELIRVYSASGTLLYDNQAGVDNGEILVSGTTFDTTSNILIGDLADASKCPTFAEFGGLNKYSVASNTLSRQTGSKNATTTALGKFKAGQVIQVENGSALTTGNPTAGLTYRIVTTDGGLTGAVGDIFVAAGGEALSASNSVIEVEYFTIDYVLPLTSGTEDTITFSSKLKYSNGLLVNDTAWTGFSATDGSPVASDTKVFYSAPGDGLNMTLDQTFEALARAYWELETANIDGIVPAGVYVDENNVVNNEGVVISSPDTFFNGEDYLKKGYEFESNGELFYAFSKDGITADETPAPHQLGLDGYAAKAWRTGQYSIDTASFITSAADLSAAVADISFGELNFAHQLARYAHGLSKNNTESFGAIATKAPTDFTRAGVSNWLGSRPILSSSGAMIRSGKGILGYKFMSGSMGQKAGFFETTTGFVDGTAVLDGRNMAIDIGRYVDVISTPTVVINSYENSAAGYISASTGLYVGKVNSLEPNQAPTEKAFSGFVSLPFKLHKEHLDKLTGDGYVSFSTNSAKAVKIVDGVTTALSTSQWKRRATNRVAGAILDWIRLTAEPFIGSIFKSTIRQNLEDMLNSGMVEFQAKWIDAGNIQLKQTKAMSIKGTAAMRLTLSIPGELRRIEILTLLS